MKALLSELNLGLELCLGLEMFLSFTLLLLLLLCACVRLDCGCSRWRAQCSLQGVWYCSSCPPRWTHQAQPERATSATLGFLQGSVEDSICAKCFTCQSKF